MGDFFIYSNSQKFTNDSCKLTYSKRKCRFCFIEDKDMLKKYVNEICLDFAAMTANKTLKEVLMEILPGRGPVLETVSDVANSELRDY